MQLEDGLLSWDLENEGDVFSNAEVRLTTAKGQT